MSIDNGRQTEGQALPLLALVVLLAGVLALGLGRMAGDAVDRAVAQTAADAAALAGAADGRDAAVSLARANGAELRDFEWAGADVRVRVTVGRMTATARARRFVGREAG